MALREPTDAAEIVRLIASGHATFDDKMRAVRFVTARVVLVALVAVPVLFVLTGSPLAAVACAACALLCAPGLVAAVWISVGGHREARRYNDLPLWLLIQAFALLILSLIILPLWAMSNAWSL